MGAIFVITQAGLIQLRSKMKNLRDALRNLNGPLTALGQVIDDIYRQDEEKGIAEAVTEANVTECVRTAICETYAPDNVSLAFFALATVSVEVQELLALMQEVASKEQESQG
jgi:hypothetical protein